MKLTLYMTEYMGFEAASALISTLPDASRERLSRCADRADKVTGELLKLRILSDCGGGEICLGESGKPYIAGRDDVAFNISHSGKLAVGALIMGDETGIDVGVDVERIDRENESRHDKIAGRFFTDAERGRIRESADPVCEFYLTWTRKEAYLKYTGDGITRPLTDIDTTALPDVVFDSRVISDNAGVEYAFSVCTPCGVGNIAIEKI